MSEVLATLGQDLAPGSQEQELALYRAIFARTFLDPSRPGQIQRFSDILEYTHSALLADGNSRDWGYLNPNRFPRRTSDGTAVNNSTVLVNDTVLKVTIGANRSFSFYGPIIYDVAAAADLKLCFTLPAGAGSSLIWGGIGLSSATAAVEGDMRSGFATSDGTTHGTVIFGGFGAGSQHFAWVSGTGTIGVNQGDLQLQMAQQMANGSDAKILMGSFLHVDIY